MKRIIINEDNLDIKDIDDTVIRVKALMVNEKNESLEESLRREIKEETGIESTIETGPFMVIEEYYNNYLDTGKTRCNKMYYYIVHSNEGPKVEEMNLSDLEKSTDFNLFYIPIKDMEQFLRESMQNNSIEIVIGKEMLAVMQEYKERHMRRK